MTLEGLEMVAVLVVLVLFVKVLEQFGLFEPVSLEGNPGSWACLSCYLGTGLHYLHAWGRGEQVSEGLLGEVTSVSWEEDLWGILRVSPRSRVCRRRWCLSGRRKVWGRGMERP